MQVRCKLLSLTSARIMLACCALVAIGVGWWDFFDRERAREQRAHSHHGLFLGKQARDVREVG
jgi:hypothetical protein